jgi:predicted MPP superfamily phosphohydrolase
MEQVIAATNAAEPDLILLTGDYVDKHPQAAEGLAQRYLSKLRARHGIYACLGNHDHKMAGGAEMVTEALSKVGIRMLNNNAVTLPDLGLQIVGMGHPTIRVCMTMS